VPVVVLLGGVVAGSLIVHQRNVKKQEYAKMDSLYVSSLNNFDFHLQRINNPDVDLTNPTHVMEALNELKKIEEYEEMKFFEKSGKEPCYIEKRDDYILKVEGESDAIDGLLYEYDGDTESGEYKKLEERMLKNDTIIVQLKQNVRAKDVVVP
jgi:hypothetical protein